MTQKLLKKKNPLHIDAKWKYRHQCYQKRCALSVQCSYIYVLYNDIIIIIESNIIWLDAVACLLLLVLSIVQPSQSCLCKLDHDYYVHFLDPLVLLW